MPVRHRVLVLYSADSESRAYQGMRWLPLFVLLFAVGCGAGSNLQTPHHLVGMGAFPPAISMLFPASAPVGSVAFTMTIVGQNFGPDVIAYWDGLPMRTFPVNSKELMAEVTVEDLQHAGLNPVYVRTGGQNSNTVNFDVLIQ